MKTQILNHKIIHWALRFIVLAGLLILVLDFAFPSKFYDFVSRTGLFDAWFIWYIASPLILIVLAGFEIWWVRKNKTEKRALVVDWFFVTAYLCAWAFSFFYPITLHSARI